MPLSQRIGSALTRGARALSGRTTVTTLAVVLLVLVTAGGIVAHRAGSERDQAQRTLRDVLVEMGSHDTLLAITVQNGTAPEEVRRSLESSRERIRAQVPQAGQDGLSSEDEERISAAFALYVEAADRELDLLDAREQSSIIALQLSTVQPAYAATQRAVSAGIARTATAAGRLRALGATAAGLAVLLLAGTVALTWLGRRDDALRGRHLTHGEARYRALLDRSGDVVLITDRTGEPKYLSPAAGRLLPEGREGEITAEDLARLVHPEDRERLAGSLATADGERGPTVVEVRAAPIARGDYRHYEVSIQDLLADPAIQGLLITVHDITDRLAMQNEMQHRALHDDLTGLPNRALLTDRLTQALRIAHRQGTHAALILIDLDRFKEINDTLGHHYGDRLLYQVGPRLVEHLRRMDTVGRLGGDEFAVLLPSVRDLEGALEVATKLQSSLAQPFRVEGVRLDVEASVGVVISGEHGDDAVTLMQRADIAMYVAKRGKLGVATYDREVDSNTPERLAMLGDLRRALHDGELFLHFQPQLDVRTGRLCSAEALLRWQHPERGLIPPDEFIPLAENTGMIGPLTTEVLNLALARIRAWVDAGRPVPVAVNLSARNLLDERLDETVGRLLERHEVPADLLKLEVTETAIVTDPARAGEVLHRLAARGLSISIDDFGAGYTSIRQLRDLPVSELKVDRSFVTDMSTNADDAVIVRSVVELGHNLGLTVVAEGVETAEALVELTAFGCDLAQGYYFSRPLPAEEFDAWRDSWSGLSGAPEEPGAAAVPHPREDTDQPTRTT